MTRLTDRVGDKVRVKSAVDDEPPTRGLVTAVAPNRLTVRLDGSGNVLIVKAAQVTNFSLAARKAWQHMPDRKVGRPKGSRVCDRVSVTIRVDRGLWERFRHAEAEGIIQDRTSTLNAWIDEGLHRAGVSGRKAS